MDGEIQLNIGDTTDDAVRDPHKKSTKERKVRYEQARIGNRVKLERIRKLEKEKDIKEDSTLPSKHPKENRKGGKGFADEVLKRDKLPNAIPNAGQLFFPHLLLKTSSYDAGKGVEKQKRKPGTFRKPKETNFGKFKRKPIKVKDKAEINNSEVSGSDFASFVSRSKIPNVTKNDKSSGKCIRKSKALHDSSKKGFKFAFVDLAEKNDSLQKTVDFSDDNIQELVDDEPKTEFLRDDERDSRIKRKKQKEFDDTPSHLASPRKSGKRRREYSDVEEAAVVEDAPKAKREKKAEKESKIEDGPVPWGGKSTSLFLNNPEIPTVARRAVRPVHEPVFANEQFSDLPIHQFSVSNLASLGLTRVMTVQRKAVPVLLEGRDALVRSQTGSGKTLAYALPLVELLQRQQPPLTRVDGVRALVVLPTRELALQTYEWFLKLVKPFMRLVPGYLVGGEKRKSEKARLRKGITILVGTPGRILDHVRHTRSLRLNRVQYLVLDEADRMHDMGYERDIASIISELDSQGQPLLSQEILNWNRKSYGKAQGASDEDGFEKKRDKAAGYASQDSGAGEEESSDQAEEGKFDDEAGGVEEEEAEEEEEKEEQANPYKLTRKELQRKKLEEEIKRRREEDETSDYDPEERADEVVNFDDDDDDEKSEGDDEEEEDQERENDDAEEWRGQGSAGNRWRGEERGEGQDERELEKDENAPRPKGPRRRQTMLLSATLTPAVERLAGLALHSPVFIDAADADANTHDVVIPDSLTQCYMVVPAKLRLVTLSAFIVWKCKFSEGRKMLLFCATQDMVDYLTELLTVGLSRKDTDEEHDSDDDEQLDDPDSNFNIGVDFFRLHGNMDQKERTHVFQTFRAAECGVLLCTDVAARGLDLPRVDWIVHYTAPGSVSDYVHRVGRTARVGASGFALLLLLPTEADFVQLLQDRRIRLQEEKMENCLKKLAMANGTPRFRRAPSVETVATSLQLRYESAVLARRSLHDAAIKAYVSFVRFYASYPKDMREVFCFKLLHLGHHAKSFALRDPPKTIAGIGRSRFYKEQDQLKKSGKRPKEHDGARRQAGGPPPSFSFSRKRTKDLVLSEFASGL